MIRRLACRAERWPLATVFATATVSSDHVDLIVAEIEQDGHCGRGEAAGVYYLGETAEVMCAQVESVRAAVETGIDRTALAGLLPAGGARNALDCALWELEARRAGTSVAALSGTDSVALTTVTTIGLASPAAMADRARALADFPILKVKLDAEDPLARIAAIRHARPEGRLIVDANTGWSVAELVAFAPPLADLGVEMIEQPCPPEQDAAIAGLHLPVPLCADESCRTTEDLERLQGYAAICIKLDKTGGLTEALRLAAAARAQGKALMVGNMLGTALGMAPASLLGAWCRFVDLDGPLLLARDREPGLGSVGAIIPPLVPHLWG